MLMPPSSASASIIGTKSGKRKDGNSPIKRRKKPKFLHRRQRRLLFDLEVEAAAAAAAISTSRDARSAAEEFLEMRNVVAKCTSGAITSATRTTEYSKKGGKNTPTPSTDT